MDTKKYQVKIAVQLTPVYHNDYPAGRIAAGSKVIDFVLTEPTVFELDIFAETSDRLSIEFLNKTDNDTHLELGLDKAIVIDWISFFGIKDPKFVWDGVYTPVYPEPWYSQAVEKPSKSLKNSNYLGWNGAWQLDFTVPVFSWIHCVQSHGWLYD